MSFLAWCRRPEAEHFKRKYTYHLSNLGLAEDFDLLCEMEAVFGELEPGYRKAKQHSGK